MPMLASVGANIQYECRGAGAPLVFVHEFAGDLRGWELQVSHFAPRRRCIAYNARGYPPSDVPDHAEAYGYAQAVADLETVVTTLAPNGAVLVGMSMGAHTVLGLALRQPALCRGIVLAGCGSGGLAAQAAQFRANILGLAEIFDREGVAAAWRASSSMAGTRFAAKNPARWREFGEHFLELSPIGAANTLRRVQALRPRLDSIRAEIATLRLPGLLIVGESDRACRDGTHYLHATLPASRLVVVPGAGHLVNLEEPELFNRVVDDFLRAVDQDP